MFSPLTISLFIMAKTAFLFIRKKTASSDKDDVMTSSWSREKLDADLLYHLSVKLAYEKVNKKT